MAQITQKMVEMKKKNDSLENTMIEIQSNSKQFEGKVMEQFASIHSLDNNNRITNNNQMIENTQNNLKTFVDMKKIVAQ